MIKQRKHLCGLLALMMLTGCGNSAGDLISVPAEESDLAVISETETTAAETTAAPSETTVQPAEKTAAGSSAENEAELIAAARAVLETYLESIRDRDVDKLLSASNYGEMMQAIYETFDVEELRREAEEAAGEQDGNLQWKVSEGRLEPDIVEQFNSSIDSWLEDAKASLTDGDEKAQRQYEALQKIFQPVDAVCAFDVTLFDEEGEETETIYLSRSNGKWTIDTMIIDSMIGYVDHSKDMSSNVAAKSLYNAVQAAMTDMDCMDIDLAKLNGDLYLTGDDLKDVSEPTGKITAPEAIRKELLWKISQYYEDACELESLAFLIRQGQCCAVAVGRHWDSGTVYGYYPLYGSDTNENDPGSIEEALAIAEKFAADAGIIP